MILWSRARPILQGLSPQCMRCYYPVAFDSLRRRGLIAEPDMFVGWRSSDQRLILARCFAAPVQATKSKPDLKEPQGPRINKAIRAEFVRLVTDEGHAIVLRREALDRAMKLKLDLVEVQRTANPPVCKIMDFHKEKYKQQIKEKDRAKSKSDVALRKGDCKEVRFSRKTEQKDLQMKAEMVKRLMERGYRVKCMAMGTEDQDLGEQLLRLSSLIEDVSIVESGPHVEKRQAYMIARHVKFGPSKKSVQKAPKVVEPARNEAQKTVPSQPKVEEEEWVPIHIASSSDVPDSGETSDLDEIVEVSPTDSALLDFNTGKHVPCDDSGTDLNNSRTRDGFSAPFEIPPSSLKVDSRELPRPSAPITPPKPSLGYDLKAKLEDKNRLAGKGEYSRNDRSPLRDSKQPLADGEKGQSPAAPSASSYGIFSSLKNTNPGDRKNLTENARNPNDSTPSSIPRVVGFNRDMSESKRDNQKQDTDKTRQGGWGIFSRETPNPNPHRSSTGAEAKVQR